MIRVCSITAIEVEALPDVRFIMKIMSPTFNGREAESLSEEPALVGLGSIAPLA